jgi:small-conductance mechanosensitive channel
MALMGLLAWPAVAVAQSQPSLAEIARQEAERRKTIKDAKKVITAKDLPESARRPVSAPATAQGGAAAPASQASPSGPSGSEQKPAPGGDTAPSGQQDEAAWRGRITRAREALARSEAFLAAFQSQVNGLTADFANASDAYSRARVDEDRQKALAQMERVKADIELSKKQIADIEEDARKAGVPPGWLR